MKHAEQKHRVGRGRVVLAAMVLAAVLAAWGSVVLAQQQEAVAAEVRAPTIFDPFALRTIMVSSVVAAGQPESPPGLVNPPPQRPPRIPFRLPVRSAFKPGQVWKTQ